MKKDKEYKPDKTLRRWMIFFFVVVVLIGGLGLYRAVLRQQIEIELDAMRTAGYPTTCVELDEWYITPPPGENAADVYMEALSYFCEWEEKPIPKEIVERFQKLDPDYDDYDPCEAISEDWDQKNRALLPIFSDVPDPEPGKPMDELVKRAAEDYLSENERALELLHQGAAMSKSRYPLDCAEGIDALVPWLSLIRSSVKMLYLKVVIDIENDESQSVGQTITDNLKLCHSLDQEPILISHLVKISCYSITIDSLCYTLNRICLSEEQLLELSSMLGNCYNAQGIIRALVGERCAISDVFRTGRDLYRGWDFPKPVYMGMKAIGLVEINHQLYLELMQENIELARKTGPARIKAISDIDLKIEEIPSYHVLTRMLIPALGRAILLDSRYQAKINSAIAALAVEQYRLARGQWPKSLSELTPNFLEAVPVDPFDGKEIKYKKLDKGYMVYSVGEDMIDDEGMAEELDSDGWVLRQEVDIIFKVER
ncbi:MAG: hypothetical protein JW860_05145 [Sedimentisphaerales bacterium]|nr:hypothetical protein [Sedimentisphaerales bacterium]